MYLSRFASLRSRLEDIRCRFRYHSCRILARLQLATNVQDRAQRRNLREDKSDMLAPQSLHASADSNSKPMFWPWIDCAKSQRSDNRNRPSLEIEGISDRTVTELSSLVLFATINPILCRNEFELGSFVESHFDFHSVLYHPVLPCSDKFLLLKVFQPSGPFAIISRALTDGSPSGFPG
jgi:hypothetical protein